MAEEEIRQLKQKIETQQAEFQNYKAQCKQLEDFMEEESSKKEDQIRKLKEDAIKREKNFGLMKNQISQLEAENNALKAQLKGKEGGSASEGLKDELEKLKVENQSIKKKNEHLANEAMKVTLAQDEIKTKLTQIDYLKQEIQQKTYELEMKDKTIKSLQSMSSQQKPVKKQEKSVVIHQKNEEQILNLTQEIRNMEEKISKQAKQIKQLKIKNSNFASEREELLREVKQMKYQKSSGKKKTQENLHFSSYENQEQQNEVFEQENKISALMLTKKHYISPFMEFKSNNTIKIYKSTKNGFQKSLGALKYKLDEITYDPEYIINNCIQTIEQNLEKGVKKNNVCIFGAKKSSKQYLMTSLISGLRELISNKLSSGSQMEAIYLENSAENDKNIEFIGRTREEIEDVINQIEELGAKGKKIVDSILTKKKGQPKPRVRYFSLVVDDEILEIMTTSHTNTPIKEGCTLAEALNQICFSKLPHVLQSADCHRQIILTLNPIVNNYEDCKVALAIAKCPAYHQVEDNFSDQFESPIKESLNETARKKFQFIEKESEQNILKTRRLEEDVAFYRCKFDELEVRLKTLLNTHSSQNSYLKKSPVTLSYQKMLKFVHNVLSRNVWHPKDRHHISDDIENSRQEIL